MNILKDYIGILTFIGVVITVYFTRKNSKSTKYIDTITSERIKWIEKIRLEVADLNSIFLTIIKNSHFIIQIEGSEDKKNSEHEDFEESINKFHDSVNKINQKDQLQNEITTFSKTDILRKINTIKLRLNPIEDEEILKLLDELMNFIIGQEITKDNLTRVWDINFKLLQLVQNMLKSEWDKVKIEARS